MVMYLWSKHVVNMLSIYMFIWEYELVMSLCLILILGIHALYMIRVTLSITVYDNV